ncbi:Uncharacterised protein [Bordetella pertussis]|nr:Uncharacterised protein [Bordetella pertussis]
MTTLMAPAPSPGRLWTSAARVSSRRGCASRPSIQMRSAADRCTMAPAGVTSTQAW